MNRRRAGCALLSVVSLLIHPLALNGQTAVDSFGAVLDVRVTNVEVLATNSKGVPVAGLTKDDFEVYEDGKRQEISNFFEITSQADVRSPDATTSGSARPSVSAVARKYIFYIDNGTVSVKNRNEIFPAVLQFLDTNMLPGDQALVVAWNRSLQIRQAWTSDRAAVKAALEKLSGELGSSAELVSEKRRAERLMHQMAVESETAAIGVTWEMVEGAIRAYAENTRHDVSMSVSAMTKLLNSMAGVEGRKILVMATEALPTQAGAELFQAFENIRMKAALSSTSTLSYGARRNSPVGYVGKYNISPLIETLARSANAAGVTVYAINPKGTDNQNSGKVELQDPSEMNAEFADSVQILDGVNILANRTGGRAMIGAPAAMALARLTQDLNAYYSIGYRSRPGSSPDRKIEVRSKRPGVTVRSRSNVYYRSIETEMADRVLANHLQSELSNELGVTLETDAVTSTGSQRLLPMRVIIPTDKLTLLPDAEGNMAGGFSVFTSAGDAAGGGSGVNVQSHQIKWPAAQAAQMKGRRIGFAVQVPMDKDPKQISVGVVDIVSQTQGFATVKVASN